MKIVRLTDVRQPGLKTDKEYVVLEMGVDNRGAHFRVEIEDGTPILVPASAVKLVDGGIPSTWICELTQPNYLRLAPRPWLEAEFWTRFFDDARHAIIEYRIERDKIIANSGAATEPKVCECPGCGSGSNADRHGPCLTAHADAPHLWERVRPSHGRELVECVECFEARVSWK
jgi:hypothetical protein